MPNPTWTHSWKKVIARRDDNWKNSSNTSSTRRKKFDLTGPGGFPLWGMRREYTWFVRQGIFVRSPISADGVKLSDEDRRKAEEQWLRRQRNREENEKRRAEARAKGEEVRTPTSTSRSGRPALTWGTSDDNAPVVPITNTDDMLKQMREPQCRRRHS